MSTIKEFANNSIKAYILSKLMTMQNCTYSELKKSDTDNALFNYHLQHLVKIGFILHLEDKYSLSKLGKEEVNKIDWNGVYFEPFTNRVLLYLIDNGKILYNKRSREPWFGDTMAITGKIPKGVKTIEYANERFLEKTGLDAQFKWIGTIRKIVQDQEDNLLMDMYYQLCYSTYFTGDLFLENPHNPKETLIWIGFEEALQIERENKSAGNETIEMIKNFQVSNFESFCIDEEIHISKL